MKNILKKISTAMNIITHKSGRPFTSAVILAAGTSTRMNGVSKQMLELSGKSVIAHTLCSFQNCELIDEIIVVTNEAEMPYYDGYFKETYGLTKLSQVVLGGNTRARSAENGFSAISKNADFVAIHDGARCLITPEKISAVVKTAYEKGAAIAATKSSDTLKKVADDGKIEGTLDRSKIWRAQTPQVFKKNIYFVSLKNCKNKGSMITDDSMMVEHAGFNVFCVETGSDNIKITTPADIGAALGIIDGRNGK